MSSKNISKKQLDLLLLGKTGNGKSATGNTILGRKVFMSCSSSESVTTTITANVTENEKYVIKVVDGPGIGDTRMDTVAGMEMVTNAMQTAIEMNVNGYHAFLLVVRYGARFDKGDTEAIQLLKKIFGSSFVRDYCIVVLTHGDNFESDAEDSGTTFLQWVKNQKGVLKEIIQECNGRVVLFDNKTTNASKMTSQIDSLLQLVDTPWRSEANRYCGEHFKRAQADREKALVEGKLPIIQDETMTETSLILQKLDEILKKDNTGSQLQPLNELQTRAGALFEKIQTQDKGTGALKKLKKAAESVKETVKSEIKICKQMIEEEERRMAMERKHEELQLQLSEEIEKSREEMEREQEYNDQRISELESRYQEEASRNQDAHSDELDSLRAKIDEMTLAQKAAKQEKEKEYQNFINQMNATLQQLKAERDQAKKEESETMKELKEMREQNAKDMEANRDIFKSLKRQNEQLTEEIATQKKKKCTIL